MPGRRLFRQVLIILGNPNGFRLHGLGNGRQVSRDTGETQHGTAWAGRTLAVVLVLGFARIGRVNTAVLLREIARRMVVYVCRGRCRQARECVAERQRRTRCHHAKQIEQGNKPPCLDPVPFGQSNEHLSQNNAIGLLCQACLTNF